MNQESRALLASALALDPDDRRWLAEALLDSLDDDEEVLKIAEARWRSLEENPDSWVSNEDAIRLAAERMGQVERGEARMVPWAEAMRELDR